MDKDLNLCTVDDDYVKYLSKYDRLVTSNKEDNRNFERKYLGTVLNINDIDYFVPLASPKDTDYFTDSDGNLRIRKSIVPLMRIVYRENNGNFTLLGKLKFSSMIPTIETVVLKYDIASETDLEYQGLIYKQWIFIRQNKDKIYKNAKTIYTQKTNKSEGVNYLNSTVDFLLLEEKAKEYIAQK